MELTHYGTPTYMTPAPMVETNFVITYIQPLSICFLPLSLEWMHTSALGNAGYMVTDRLGK